MARNMTERLLAELNAARGLKYPDLGYSYFADVKGMEHIARASGLSATRKGASPFPI
ncbi:hypothetical protein RCGINGERSNAP_101 [Rhodobacter phage RcGingersnap]|nr:hypothetical protein RCGINGERSNAP_101 [Rhodobacter phage RcGingersnap]